ncbi:flagellar hook-length control protein FliK [Caldicellulosiruptor naganoensis]|uniref:flagellar hook-length control protein FliK n=1 Tax=Caldicellulosiruptor naganoensis TaxID=29324 RepID=UPI000A6FDAC9|nr:flagellar hook-length control protein FliK [Caldicellulosiruptor naganoensis]
MRVNNLLFAASSNKVEESLQKPRQGTQSSFKKIFDRASKRTTENITAPKTDKNEDSGRFAVVLNPKIRQVITQDNKSVKKGQGQTATEVLQEATQPALKEEEKISDFVLNLILSLLQNTKGQAGEFFKQILIKEENAFEHTIVKEMINTLNAIKTFDADVAGQEKNLVEIFNIVGQVSKNVSEEAGNGDWHLAKLVFESAEVLGLSTERSNSIDNKIGLKDNSFSMLENILLKNEKNDILPPEWRLINKEVAFLKKLVQVLSENSDHMVNHHSNMLNNLYENVTYDFEARDVKSTDNLQLYLGDLKEDISAQTNEETWLHTVEKLENKDPSDDRNEFLGKISSKFDANTLSKVEIRADENVFKALRASVIEQIAEKISLIHKQNLTTLTVSIKPEWLGNVVIELNRDLNGNITGNIIVSNPQVKEIVESSLSNLLTILKDQGINISQLNVSLGNSHSSQQFQSQQRFSQKQYSFAQTEDTMDTIEGLIYEISENVLNLRA